MSVKRKCKFDIHQLTALCLEFAAIGEEELTSTLKHDELERKWRKLKESYESFAIDEKSKASEDLKDGISVKYAAASETYQRTKAKLMEKMSDQGTIDQSLGIQTETTVGQHPRSGLRLPPCDMQIFEGGFTK